MLAGLGELGLSPPIVPMTGPNAEATREMLYAHLQSLENGEYTPVEWPPEVQAETRRFLAEEEARRQRAAPMDDRECQEIISTTEHGLSQAERGEGMTVAEAKERTMAAIMRVAAEISKSKDIRDERDSLVNDLIAEIGAPSAEGAQAIDEFMAAGERITKRDAEALRLLRED